MTATPRLARSRMAQTVPRGIVDPRIRAMEMIHNGALMQLPGTPPMLVGEMRWLLSSAIAWVPAFADRLDDVRVITFDAVRSRPNRLVFLNGSVVAAELSPITGAVVDDPDDYRVGWQLWLEVAPLRRAFLEACFTRVTRLLATPLQPSAAVLDSRRIAEHMVWPQTDEAPL